MARAKIFIIVGLALALLGGFFGYRLWQYAIIDVYAYESVDDFTKAGHTSPRELEIYEEKLERAYREDTYGSTTPEGTLQLFIDALKAGDTDLAAKYFIIEKQRRMTEELRIGKENGGIETFLKILDGERHLVPLLQNTYRIRSQSKEGSSSIDFRLNQIRQIWKIESL